MGWTARMCKGCYSRATFPSRPGTSRRDFGATHSDAAGGTRRLAGLQVERGPNAQQLLVLHPALEFGERACSKRRVIDPVASLCHDARLSMATPERRMPDSVIQNPVPNAPYRDPARHWRFTDEGITNDVVETRRSSAYFVPIPPPEKKGKQLEFETGGECSVRADQR